MKIESGNKTLIKGFYNLDEEEFIANYFVFLSSIPIARFVSLWVIGHWKYANI